MIFKMLPILSMCHYDNQLPPKKVHGNRPMPHSFIWCEYGAWCGPNLITVVSQQDGLCELSLFMIQPVDKDVTIMEVIIYSWREHVAGVLGIAGHVILENNVNSYNIHVRWYLFQHDFWLASSSADNQTKARFENSCEVARISRFNFLS